jgi:hypothetical protein
METEPSGMIPQTPQADSDAGHENVHVPAAWQLAAMQATQLGFLLGCHGVQFFAMSSGDA